MSDIRKYINIVEAEQRLVEGLPSAALRMIAPMVGAAARAGSKLIMQGLKELAATPATTNAADTQATGSSSSVKRIASFLGQRIEEAAITQILALSINVADPVYQSVWGKSPQAAQLNPTSPNQVTQIIAVYLSQRGLPNAQAVAGEIVNSLKGEIQPVKIASAASAASEALYQVWSSRKAA